MNQRFAATALIVATGLAVAGEYMLDEPGLRGRAAMASLDQAQISLARAVALAEASVVGRATQAQLTTERGIVVADVEVATADHKLFAVKVNAIDGSIVSSRLRHGDEN
jgi:uncharacterized membrane protein YkoI